MQKRKLSQKKLGDLLDIGQQAAGLLARSDAAGFSHPTARRLIEALGYASVDSFFRSRGVLSESPHAKSA